MSAAAPKGASSPWDPGELPRATKDPSRLKADMDGYGYCLVEGALSAEEVGALRRRMIEQAEAERNQGHATVFEGRNQWVGIILNKGRLFHRTLFHPLVRAVVGHVLGPEHILSNFAGPITWPGNDLSPLHTDQWWMPPPAEPGASHVRAGGLTRQNAPSGPLEVAHGPISPPCCINAMWMLTEFSDENGGTRLVPRSHLSGVQPEPVVPHTVSSVAAEGPAGNVVIWEGRTWHAAGANVSDEPRYGLVTLYCGPQFRMLDNFTLGIRPEVYKDASPELLSLIGFKPWHGYGRAGDTVTGDFAQPGAELVGELKL